ncbi:MAG: hypothetical protein Tsb0019_01610 [Roseibium sp.]
MENETAGAQATRARERIASHTRYLSAFSASFLSARSPRTERKRRSGAYSQFRLLKRA